jgi:hypothetical protein
MNALSGVAQPTFVTLCIHRYEHCRLTVCNRRALIILSVPQASKMIHHYCLRLPLPVVSKILGGTSTVYPYVDVDCRYHISPVKGIRVVAVLYVDWRTPVNVKMR